MKNVVFKRFLRTFVPQLPAIFVALAGFSPDYIALFVFLGAVATALDKFLRDSNIY